MRIAYLGHVLGGVESGVLAKMAGQAAAWRAEGHEARLFLFTRDAGTAAHEALGDLVIGRYGGPASRLTAMTRLVAGIRRFRPDVVYVRWDLFYPPMLALPRASALAVEINTDDVAEYAAGWARAAMYNRLTRHLVLGRADLLVFVTDELRRSRSFARFRGRRATVSNGVDLASYPVTPPPRNPQPRLVFVGSANQRWQGIDKVARLAERHPEWCFDVVGSAARAERGLPNVTWHGAQDRRRTLEIMAGADVGIGTLALHRKGMNEACALKVRDYLAVGLPVLVGNADPDLRELAPWVLQIPNTETNVEESDDAIAQFVARSRGQRIPREAVAHIDTHVKERARLALFREVGGAGR